MKKEHIKEVAWSKIFRAHPKIFAILKSINEQVI